MGNTMIRLGLGILAFGVGVWLTQYWQGRALRRHDLPTHPPEPPRSLPPTKAPSLSQAALERQIQGLVAQRQHIAAIKLLRQHTNWNLKTARAYVLTVAAQPPLHGARVAAHHRPASPIPPEVEREVQQLVDDRQIIAAIKRICETTGWDLQRAKTYVEQLVR